MTELHRRASPGQTKSSAPGVEPSLSWQRSTQDALKFTFSTIGSPIVKISQMERGRGNFGNLTPQERHGQAAMIMACVERSVDSIEMAYLRAYYGHELHNGDLARIVMDILVQAVVGSLGTGLHKRRGIQKLILNYFGHDIAFRHIRTELACSLDNANKMRIQVYDALSDLGARAERDAENALYNAGIIKE